MGMIVGKAEREGAGFLVPVEITGEYTRGRSKHVRVHLERAELSGTRAEKMKAIREALDDPMREMRGVDISNVEETRDTLARRAAHFYATWQRWKNTRVEADIRTMAAPFINVLIDTEDAAWNAYMDVLKDWRNAP